MSKIKNIKAREILDSRGNPTIEVEVILNNKKKSWAAVPSGASTGRHEALELRDNDKKRYFGKGVLKAISNINNIIAPKIVGLNPESQERIDGIMIDLDGTKNKSALGANSILGVSLAVARAAAINKRLPLYKYLRSKFFNSNKNWVLPIPIMNIINGGVHADWCNDIQEFMILPLQKTAKERIRCGAEIFYALGKILKKNNYSIMVGDEGGYSPKLKENEEALELIMKAIKFAGYTPGKQVKLGIDVAASEFQKSGKYQFKSDEVVIDSNNMIELYKDWISKYPLVFIEDGLAEDDWSGWQNLTKAIGKKTIVIGDDLFATNVERLKRGIEAKAANAILIKPNQIGTLTETINAIKLAQENNFKISISHRSGETNDYFITDLAVAANAGFIKAGSLSRGERIAKYNRLMEIEEELN